MGYICEICNERPCNAMKHIEQLEDRLDELVQLLFPNAQPHPTKEQGKQGTKK